MWSGAGPGARQNALLSVTERHPNACGGFVRQKILNSSVQIVPKDSLRPFPAGRAAETLPLADLIIFGLLQKWILAKSGAWEPKMPQSSLTKGSLNKSDKSLINVVGPSPGARQNALFSVRERHSNACGGFVRQTITNSSGQIVPKDSLRLFPAAFAAATLPLRELIGFGVPQKWILAKSGTFIKQIPLCDNP